MMVEFFSIRVMAKEAEAERERRAKIVAAEGEYQASVKLRQAADIITQHPVVLQLRTLQTMAEIATEKNSTIIFPAQFMTTVQDAIAMLNKDLASQNSFESPLNASNPLFGTLPEQMGGYGKKAAGTRGLFRDPHGRTGPINVRTARLGKFMIH